MVAQFFLFFRGTTGYRADFFLPGCTFVVTTYIGMILRVYVGASSESRGLHLQVCVQNRIFSDLCVKVGLPPHFHLVSILYLRM